MVVSAPFPQKAFLNSCLRLCRRAAGAWTMLPSLVVSALFILLTLVLAHGARQLVQKIVRNDFIRTLMLEAIAASELCGCCFELVIVADNFGVYTYAVILFLLTIWWSHNWGDATACPYVHYEDVIAGNTSIRTAILKTWAELVGGLFIFRYVQFLWSLEIAETHIGRAFGDCTTDLQVPVVLGAAIEAGATCLCRLASKTLAELEPKFTSIIDSFISTSLVVAAFDYSGGYFNPVLASSLKLGCYGTTFPEHVIVYWIGASSGAILSVYMYKHPALQKMLLGEEKKKEE